MDTLLPSKPSTYSQLIKNSLKLYQYSFIKIIGFSLVIAVIAFVPRLLADLTGQDIFVNNNTFNPHHLWFIFLEILGFIFFIGILWHMYCVLRNKHEPFIEDIYVGLKKVFYVVLAALIQGAIIFAITLSIYGVSWWLKQHYLLSPLNPHPNTYDILFITLLFTLPLALIIYIYTLFIFLIPLIAIENKGVWSALTRSAYLVWNHWWRVFSVQFTPWVCYVLLLFFIRVVFHINLYIYLIGQPSHHLGTTLFHIVIFALYVPWVAALLLVQLKDLELRKHVLSKKLQ